jgi:hypothetical protein
MQWVSGAVSPGVKRQGREAFYTLPYNFEVKNAWNYTSTSSTCLHGVVFSKAQGDFTFTFRINVKYYEVFNH